jgi:hypothetical protein
MDVQHCPEIIVVRGSVARFRVKAYLRPVSVIRVRPKYCFLPLETGTQVGSGTDSFAIVTWIRIHDEFGDPEHCQGTVYQLAALIRYGNVLFCFRSYVWICVICNGPKFSTWYRYNFATCTQWIFCSLIGANLVPGTDTILPHVPGGFVCCLMGANLVRYLVPVQFRHIYPVYGNCSSQPPLLTEELPQW